MELFFPFEPIAGDFHPPARIFRAAGTLLFHHYFSGYSPYMDIILITTDTLLFPTGQQILKKQNVLIIIVSASICNVCNKVPEGRHILAMVVRPLQCIVWFWVPEGRYILKWIYSYFDISFLWNSFSIWTYLRGLTSSG
jgi:hypothetical protein